MQKTGRKMLKTCGKNVKIREPIMYYMSKIDGNQSPRQNSFNCNPSHIYLPFTTQVEKIKA